LGEGAGAVLRARLDARREELESAVLTRVNAISDPGEIGDPSYAESLRAAVAIALDYALEAIERGEARAPQPPPMLLAQARLAARVGVGLDTVLRRYFAGYTLLGEFLLEETRAGEGTASAQPLRAHAALFDRLIADVSEEYRREASERTRSVESRRAERVRRLLDGEPLDTAEFDWDLSAFHLGLVAAGPGAAEALAGLAAPDYRLLLVRPGAGLVWVWLVAHRRLDPGDLALEGLRLPEGVCLAVGEPGEGIDGWRLTHRQAKAALPIARSDPKRLARYADVALLASVRQDDLLATSLRRLYFAPLESERDGGAALLRTLRAYFAAGRNVSSTAAALGVDRKTITARLRNVERRLRKPLTACAVELEVALRLQDLWGQGADSHKRPATR
jgi:hypothetical protein